ncbi:MAG: S-layer homology domain-containing protein [Clostridiales bacterium]|nr:S-layer homology domain-containing protein [Clostridiales bacterium]
MKKTTRALALALSLLLAFSGLTAAAAPEAGELYRILNAAEIMTFDAGGDFNAGASLTRAQLAKILVSASEHRGQAGDSSRISPFRDVPFTHWGAPHIAVARDTGLMRGYADGRFAPDQPVLYEEAVVAALNLLRYSAADYTGAYPQGPVAKAKSLNLLDGVSGGIGASMTRDGMAHLIYNALNKVPNGGAQPQAALLGYKITADTLSLGDVTADSSKGPFTYKDASTLAGFGLSNPAVYRGGEPASAQALQRYDILYYSAQANTVWAYSKKASGTLEAVLPNREAPASILLSGSSYTLSSAAASAAVGTGGIATGRIVTALLDRDGRVADLYPAEQVNGELIGLAVAAGTKPVLGSGGTAVSSHFLTVALMDGSRMDVPIAADRPDMVGKPVRVTLSAGGASVQGVDEQSVFGAVSAAQRSIGTQRLSGDLRILDVDGFGNMVQVPLERLDGLTLKTAQVHAATRNAAGEVDSLLLADVTGDGRRYGILNNLQEVDLSGAPGGDKQVSPPTLSGLYRYDLAGTAGSATTSGLLLRAVPGPAGFSFNGAGQLLGILNLVKIEGSVAQLGAASLTTDKGVRHKLSGSVAVYDVSGVDPRYSSIDELLEQGHSSITAYADKPEAEGGLIRVIYYS